MSTVLNKLFNKDYSYSDDIHQILLFGTGGGSDILSALLLAAIIVNKVNGTHTTDLAGMLSPGSKHFYGSENEQIINTVKRPNIEIEQHSPVRRFIDDAHGLKEISFVDAHIWRFIDEFNKLLIEAGLKKVNVENVYHFSTKFGVLSLTNKFNNIVDEMSYSEVIALDVGGDITANSTNDRILSPLMDLTALWILNGLRAEKSLIEMGWGSDGENANPNIRDYLGVYASKIIANEMTVNHDEIIVKICDLFSQIFHNHISKIRSGHTIPLLLARIIKNIVGDVVSEHNYTYRVGEKKLLHKFNVTTGNDTGKIYELKISELFNSHQGVMFGSANPLFHCARLKSVNPNWATEIDGHVIDYIQTKTGIKNVFKFGCALFSKSLPEMERKDLILTMLNNKNMSFILFSSDVEKYRNEMPKLKFCSSASYSDITFASENESIFQIASEYEQDCPKCIDYIDWMERDGVNALFLNGTFTPFKIRKLIPKGMYCYDKDGICPFWRKNKLYPEQLDGYCHLLKKGDWEIKGGLLWDQCKECEINVKDTEEESS